MVLDSNALFYEFPKVCDLKAFLGEPGSEIPSSSNRRTSSSSSETGSTMPRSSATAIRTGTYEGSLVLKVDFQRTVQITLEESGVVTDGLTNDTNFVDFGIDSLLSFVIFSRTREELKLNIQHESLLIECPTVVDLK
ncbi:hypothetical protein MMC15_005357 [Xylographa vitiligo]|nr:hypothetical protein [Xylographa vitiligo]